MASQHDLQTGKAGVMLGYLKPGQLAECLRICEDDKKQKKSRELSSVLLEKGYLNRFQLAEIEKQISSNSSSISKETSSTRVQTRSAHKKAQSEDAEIQTPGVFESGAGFGRYDIIQELGRGGMGCVYKALDKETGKIVALKVLLSSETSETDMERFMREARSMAQLHHPYIVGVYDLGIINGRQYFTMDFIEGQILETMFNAGTLTIRQIVKIMMKICDAIEYAHSQGIIHRDLKPSNIMLTKDNEPKIMDFGLAKIMDTKESKKLSQSGTIIGTLHYMPPEQALGKVREIDKRSDIYSLGVILYQALTERPPFVGASFADLISEIANQYPLPPSQLKWTIPKDLDTVCLKALEKDKSKRYQSAKELGEDLARFSRGEPVRAKPLGIKDLLVRKAHTHKTITVAILSVVLCLVCLTIAISIWEKLAEDKQYENWSKQILYSMDGIASSEELVKKYGLDKNLDLLSQDARQDIENTLQRYIKTRFIIEQAMAVFPHRREIRSQMYKVEQEIGLLGLLAKNYVLSQIFFERCKSLNGEAGERLLQKLKEKREETQNIQIARIHEIMAELERETPEQGMIDEYITEITRMHGEHATRILIPYLNGKNEWQRKVAIETLGKLGDKITRVDGKDAVEWLMEKLNTLDLKNQSHEAESIIWALGRLKDPKATILVSTIRLKCGDTSNLWQRTKIPCKWLPDSKEMAYSTGLTDSKETMDEVENLMKKADIKMERGDRDGAIAIFSRIISLDPKNAMAYNKRGIARNDKGEKEEAIVDFTQAISLFPKFAIAYHNRGHTRHRMLDLDGAIADYTQALSLDPNLTMTYNNRGNAWSEKGDKEKAMEDYTRALSLDPKFSWAYNNRANVRLDKRDFDGAIADCTQAISLDPTYAFAYNNRGNAWREKGDKERAMADYVQAISLDPRLATAYYGRGTIRYERNDIDGAIADFTKAISFSPKLIIAYNSRGIARHLKNDFDGAIEDYNKAIALEPKLPLLYNNRGNSRRDKGDMDGAMDDYNKALSLDPNLAMAYKNRGLAYNKNGKTRNAVSDFRNYLRLNPQAPDRQEVEQYIKKYGK